MAQVTTVSAYTAALTAAGINSVHNGFLVMKYDENQIYAGTGNLNFVLVAGTGGSLVTTGFTAGDAGWAVGTAWVRHVGGGMAHLYYETTKTGSVQNVSISGEFTNVTVGNVPAAYAPHTTAVLTSGGTGRVASGSISNTGAITLAAVAPGAGIVVGETISLGGVYRLASATI
jgi:hypothetical protein